MADVTFGQLAEYAIDIVGFNVTLRDEEKEKYVKAANRAVCDIYTAIAPYCDWSWSFAYSQMPAQRSDVVVLELPATGILGGTDPRVAIINGQYLFDQYPFLKLGRDEFLRRNKDIYKNSGKGNWPECYGIYAMNGSKSISAVVLKDGWAKSLKLPHPNIGVLWIPDYDSCFRHVGLPKGWGLADEWYSEVEHAREVNQNINNLADKIIPLPDEYCRLAYAGAASYSRLVMPSTAKAEIDAEVRVKFELELRDAVQVAQERYFGNKRIRCHGF